MILKNLNPTFDPNPKIESPISEELIQTLPFKNFDKDGYELETIERLYYNTNKVPLNTEIQHHTAPVQEWFIDEQESEQGLVLDHAMILTRYQYDSNAKLQLENIIEKRPIFQKLLRIRPKWGIDFSLDYIERDNVIEVFHIEQDFIDYDEANQAKIKLEHLVETTDWEAGVEELLERKQEWIDLCSDDHSDYKAKFFGWHRAFDNKKNFS